MSTIKVQNIQHTGSSTNAIALASDGTCTANITNNLSNRNMVINGASEISQRYGTTSTSISSTGQQFPVDRFIVQTNLGSGHSHQQVADAPTGFYYSQKVTCGTGGSATGSNFGRYRTTLEWQNVIPQSGFGTASAKSLVLSFYVKSSLTGTFGFTVQSYANNRAITNTYTINSANTWERKTIVIAADTNSAWVATTAIHIELGWDLGEGPDRGTDTLNTWGGGQSGYGYDSGTKFFTQSGATWQITGVQLEVDNTGSGVATDFEHRSFADELRRCQRYYAKYSSSSSAYAQFLVTSGYATDTDSRGMFNFIVEMRVDNPSFAYSGSSGNVSDFADMGGKSINLFQLTSAGTGKFAGIRCIFSQSNTSNGFSHVIRANNTTNAFFAFDAEL